MPAPVDKKGVLRLLGVVAYLQKFAPNLSKVTTLLRQLVKGDTEFVWGDDVHGDAMSQVQQILSSAPVLHYFNPKLDIVLQ